MSLSVSPNFCTGPFVYWNEQSFLLSRYLNCLQLGYIQMDCKGCLFFLAISDCQILMFLSCGVSPLFGSCHVPKPKILLSVFWSLKFQSSYCFSRIEAPAWEQPVILSGLCMIIEKARGFSLSHLWMVVYAYLHVLAQESRLINPNENRRHFKLLHV